MKKLLLLALAACIPFCIAMAQPDPLNFHLIYGNTDLSPITVGIDKDVQIPIWVSTDPTPGNTWAVSSCHMPLMSDDAVISGRLGGAFDVGTATHWDDISFLTVDDNSTDPLVPVGKHSQSILGFAYLTDPEDAAFYWVTMGAWKNVGYFLVHTANDPALVPTTPCPFGEGHNAANAGLTWGMSDGVSSVVPTTSYGCLFFSPNQVPVWTTTTFTVNTLYGVNYSFHLVGTDPDLGNTLTISKVGGGVVGTGTGGNIDVVYTGSSIADEDLTFTLYDGTDYAVASLVIHINVTVKPGLILGNQDGTCVPGYPGGDVWIPVYYNTPDYCGGFVILVQADPTALTLTDYQFTARDNWGSEMHQYIPTPYGAPGTDKFVWIANMNDGVYTAPAVPDLIGTAPILWLKYHISNTLGIGFTANVLFLNDGPNSYTYNTTSDSTGYIFTHPLQPLNSQGFAGACINIISADHYKGDPNMNGIYYEIADDVLVARRLIHGASDSWIWTISITIQEAASDLNDNGFADVADLVRFVKITTGEVPMPPHPKTDPNAVDAYVSMGNNAVAINSSVDVAGALVRISHTGELTPVATNGMDMLYEDNNGILSVVVYSTQGHVIPAGQQTLFTLNGTGTITEASAADNAGDLLVSRVGAPVPTQFAVSQNYPNPFNAKTLIKFALPTASDVTINIYNITGQVVKTFSNHYEAGNQQVVWDASDVASGVYFAKVSTGSNSQTMKMTLLK